MTTATSPPIHEESVHAENDWRSLPDDRRYEMVDGELVELPPMRRAPAIVAGKIYRLFEAVRRRRKSPFLGGDRRLVPVGIVARKLQDTGRQRNCRTIGNAGYRR